MLSGSILVGGNNKKITTSDLGYISDNIYCHFDGIYNFGGYSHNSNLLNCWISLNDNSNLMYRNISDSTLIGDNFYKISSSNNLSFLNYKNLNLTNFTIELIYSWHSTIINANYLCTNFPNGLGFCVRNNKHRFFIYNSSTYYVIDSVSDIAIDKIYCLQATYNGSKVIFYENGIKIKQIDFNSFFNSTNILNIGNGCDIKCYGFRIYNLALNETQLLQNFNTDKQRYSIT